jgi:hypothetical protein
VVTGVGVAHHAIHVEIGGHVGRHPRTGQRRHIPAEIVGLFTVGAVAQPALSLAQRGGGGEPLLGDVSRINFSIMADSAPVKALRRVAR